MRNSCRQKSIRTSCLALQSRASSRQGWPVSLVRFCGIACHLQLLICGSCIGLGLGAFFSLMSSSFAYEDPLLRPQAQANAPTAQKAREIFRDMGKGMWRSGKGFGKVGALFAGLECAVESVCHSMIVS